MSSDMEFLASFEAQRIAPESFHHREHVRLAYLYLKDLPFEQAAARIRQGIMALNAALGTVDRPTSGYHETMTIGWLRLVEAMLEEYGPEKSSDAFCDAHPELLQKKSLRLFYSKDRFMSATAKSDFVEPDLAPLPVARRPRDGVRDRGANAGGSKWLLCVTHRKVQSAARTGESCRSPQSWDEKRRLLWAMQEPTQFLGVRMAECVAVHGLIA